MHLTPKSWWDRKGNKKMGRNFPCDLHFTGNDSFCNNIKPNKHLVKQTLNTYRYRCVHRYPPPDQTKINTKFGGSVNDRPVPEYLTYKCEVMKRGTPIITPHAP